MTNSSTSVIVNVTLTVANPLHISEQNAISSNAIPGPTRVSLMEEDHEYTPKVSNVKLPSYTSKNDFASKFGSLERGLSSVMEIKTYQSSTNSRGDDITTLKLSKDVSSLSHDFTSKLFTVLIQCFTFRLVVPMNQNSESVLSVVYMLRSHKPENSC